MFLLPVKPFAELSFCIPGDGMGLLGSPHHPARTTMPHFPAVSAVQMPTPGSDVTQHQAMAAHQTHWPVMMQRGAPPQGPMYKPVMTSAASAQPNFGQPRMVRHPVMDDQGQMQQNLAPSPGSAGQTQFPFPFNSSATMSKLGEMHGDKPGMSNTSPMLVNLLQTDGPGGMQASPGQQPVVATVPTPPKTKRKKQPRKKKPAKPAAASTPPTPGMTVYPSGMYAQHDAIAQQQMMDGNSGQFMNPRLQHFSMQGIGQDPQAMAPGMESQMRPMNPMVKMNYREQKPSVIETINRSDVGGQGAPFSASIMSGTPADVMGHTSGPPVFQRPGAVRMPSHVFPPGFDPNQPAQFQPKHAVSTATMQQQQQQQQQQHHQPQPQGFLSGSQMIVSQFSQFDQSHSRPVLAQQQHHQMQQQQQQMLMQQQQQQQTQGKTHPYSVSPGCAGHFQGAMQQTPMMQQNIIHPQQHFAMTPDGMHSAQPMMSHNVTQGQYVNNHPMQTNLNNSSNKSFPNVSASDLKQASMLPSLAPEQNAPLSYPAQSPSVYQIANRSIRSRVPVGRLPNGALSVLMKGSCVGQEAEKLSPGGQSTSRPSSRPGSVSALPKKSPGSSMDSMPFGSPSPKAVLPSTPSPLLNSVPSPHASHGGSRSATPRSRTPGTAPRQNLVKSLPVQRRPSLDQYVGHSPGPSRGFGSAPGTPVNVPTTPCSAPVVPATNFTYHAHNLESANPYQPKPDPQTHFDHSEQPYPPHQASSSYWPHSQYGQAQHSGTSTQWPNLQMPLTVLQSYPSPFPPKNMQEPARPSPRASMQRKLSSAAPETGPSSLPSVPAPPNTSPLADSEQSAQCTAPAEKANSLKSPGAQTTEPAAGVSVSMTWLWCCCGQVPAWNRTEPGIELLTSWLQNMGRISLMHALMWTVSDVESTDLRWILLNASSIVAGVRLGMVDITSRFFDACCITSWNFVASATDFDRWFLLDLTCQKCAEEVVCVYLCFYQNSFWMFAVVAESKASKN